MDTQEKQTFDKLLEAAEATMHLWIMHGLGDDENESGPVYLALEAAILEARQISND